MRWKTRELPRLRVLCIVDRVPGTLRGLYTATRGSFFAELIEMAGGESIAPPASNGFGQISKEDLMWKAIIHMVFVVSGVLLALMDLLTVRAKKSQQA